MISIINIVISHIILAILRGDKLNDEYKNELLEYELNTETIFTIFNSIIIPHKQRYLQCYTDKDRSEEMQRMINDYEIIFDAPPLTFIDSELLKCVFQFVVNKQYYSTSFKENCINMLQLIDNCEIVEVQIQVYQKLINYIIHCSLYGDEAFNSILKQASEKLESLIQRHGIMPNYKFLE